MILVTGATGYVGTNLISRLSKSHKVRCLVREDCQLQHNVEVFDGNLFDRESLDRATKNIDSVVHLAAVIKSKDNGDFFKVNVEGTRNLVDACVRNKVKKFVYISSYDVVLKNKDAYAISKVEAEKIVRSSGLDYMILRPTVIYGKNDNRNLGMLFNSIKKYSLAPIIGKGNYKLQPVHVDDVIEAIVKCLESGKTKKTYFIAGSEILTFNDIVDKVSGVLSKKVIRLHIPLSVIKVALVPYEKLAKSPFMTNNRLLSAVEDKTCDISETETDLGFKPMSFNEGLKKVFG